MFSKFKNGGSSKNDQVEKLLSGAESADDVLRRRSMTGVWIGGAVLAIGLGGFLVWATTAPIDEGVPAQGVVAVEAKRKSVQHLAGGTIGEIRVREAQPVKEGDVLIRLETTALKANRDASEQAFAMTRAAEARLVAEQRGAAAVEFPSDLSAAHLSAAARVSLETQRSLFHSRRASLESDLQVLAEGAANHEAQAATYAAQLEFHKQELAGVRELAAEGYVARNRQFEMERQAAELVGNMARAKQNAAEMRARALQRKAEYLKEVETHLAETRRDAAIAAEKLRVAQDELAQAEIRAPASGHVVGLAVHTVGGVIRPGERLLDIVPADVPLVIEAHVQTHLIDKVKVGLLANISLQTFANAPDLTVEGRVVTVSADMLIDERNAAIPPYYLAQVEVTPEGARKLSQYKLQPGMPASVVIRTGERTFMNYVLKPLLRRLHTSLTES